jgi:hypothetical protein
MRTSTAALLVVFGACIVASACGDGNPEPAVAPPMLDGTSAAAGQCIAPSPEAGGEGGAENAAGAGQGCHRL